MYTDTFSHVQKDSGMEGMVARWYAATTGKSRDDFTDLARRIAREVAPNGSVLEIAPGPGYFAIELAKRGAYSITGLDLSHTFVDIARTKAAEEGVGVDFRQGNASDMPFADNSFDFFLCRAAFKNFARPVRALHEMYRVLKPGGRGLIIDLRRDVSQHEIDRHVEGIGTNAINKLMINLVFRTVLLKRAYTKEQFRQMLSRVDFREVDIRQENIGFDIWLTK